MRRGVVSVLLAGGLAVSVVAGDPLITSASAAVVPPPLVTVGSSALAATAGEAGTAATVGSLTATGGAAVAAEAAGGTAALGFVGGFVVGGKIATWLPSGDSWWEVGDDASGSSVCDLKRLLNPTETCAMSAADGFVANTDVGTDTGGWVPKSTATVQLRDEAVGQPTVLVSRTMSVGLSSDASFHATTGSVTVSVTADGPAYGTQYGQYRLNQALWVYMYGSDGYCAGSSMAVRAGVVDTTQFTFTSSCPLDHIEIAAETSTNVVMKYYPVGHTSRPVVVANPVRWWRTDWKCSDGSASSATSATWQETDASIPSAPTAVCSAGTVTEVTISEVWESGTKVVTSWTAAPAVTSWISAHGTDKELHLYRVDEGTGADIDCHTSSSVCANWWTETTQATTNTEQYECRYGSEVVALAECTVYAHAFDLGVYSNPATGETTDVTGDTPDADDGCPPPFSWTSLVNPWWYYKGVACALSDAFVPSATSTNLARIRAAVDATAPVQWSEAVGGMFAGLHVSESGCEGPHLQVDMFGALIDAYPFSACQPPMTHAASVTKAIATALLVVFGSMACVRALGSGFGWKPSAGGDS